MTLLARLRDAVQAQSKEQEVALLLSGGLDSTSVGIALTKAGKTVRAYTYELRDYPSRDRAKAVAIAQHFGWPLTLVTISPESLREDFLTLAVNYRCKTKVQFEVTYPLLHIIPRIVEREIWTGWNADDHFGNEWKERVTFKGRGVSAEDGQSAFVEWRRRRFEVELQDPNSSLTWWWLKRLAEDNAKSVLDPYLAPSVRAFFEQFEYDDLVSLKKPVVRRELESELKGLTHKVTTGVQLQKGGGVDALFETLLADPEINPFGCSTVSGMCRRWGKERNANAQAFSPRIVCAKSQQVSTAITLLEPIYHPYSIEDVHCAAPTGRFNVVSLFAGGGASSIGYSLAGGRVLRANELVPEAARTYRRNFPRTQVDQRDLRAILAPKEAERFLAEAGLEIGQLDVLDGSPPCSEFSVIGGGMRDGDELRSYSDVRQRNISSLPFDFGRFLAHAKPKTFVMENVPGLTYAPSRPLFERLLRALRTLDDESRQYCVAWRILNAADFGVPQARRRLFVLGVRQDAAESVGIADDDAVKALFPTPTHMPISVRAALSGLQQAAEDVRPWIEAAVASSDFALVKSLPKGGATCVRSAHAGGPTDKNFTVSRCAWDLPAPTLVVSGQMPHGWTGAVHPDQDRKFTIPELKRLSALPDDYIVTGTLAQAAERICRGVPPLLTKAIGERIFHVILSKCRT